MTILSARELALHAARIALDKGGEQLRLLAFPPGDAVFDYCLLVNGRSDRQVHAIVDEIYHFCKRHHIPRMPIEGEVGWMLIDCIDVVVHAFNDEKRDLYRLDNLWPTASEVDVPAELAGLADPDAALPGVARR
jgi:ribosome-associated protein